MGTTNQQELCNSPIRNEMGWRTIRQEIRRKKLLYWLKLKQRKPNRWTTKTLEWATQNPNKSKWMTEINKGLREIQWTNDSKNEKPLNAMKTKLKTKENEELREELKDKKCEHYPKTKIQGREQYMYKKRNTKGLLKFRTRDLETGPQKNEQKCHKCNETKGNIVHHVLYKCKTLNDIRKGTYLASQKLEGKTEQEINEETRKMLENTKRENTEVLQKMWEKWNEKEGEITDRKKGTKKNEPKTRKKTKRK